MAQSPPHRCIVESLEHRRLLAASVVNTPGYVRFDRTIVDPTITTAGHKAKVLADIDGDGFVDVAALTPGDGLSWYRYPSWTKSKIWNGGDESYEEAHAFDVDNDGDNDILIADRWFENPLRQGGNPTGGLWAEHNIGSGDHHDVEIGDINLDGKIDLATQTGIFLQTGGSSWQLLGNNLFPDRGGVGTTFGDVDNDGDLDLLGPSKTAPYQLLWFENPTIGTNRAINTVWTKRVISAAYAKVSVVVVDMNKDGRNDVVLAPEEDTGGGPLVWLKAPSNPKAAAAKWALTQIDPFVDAVHTGSIKPADFNLDGHLDLFLVEQEQTAQDRLMIFYGNGTGQRFVKQVFPPPGGGHNPKIGDLDRDGDIDILNANHGFFNKPNPIDIWRNQTNRIIPTVTLSASDRSASEINRDPGIFTITRSPGVTTALTVRYAIRGSALNGTDYTKLTGFVIIPVGQRSVNVIIRPITDSNSNEGPEAISMTLLPDSKYSIGIGATVTQTRTIVIADSRLPTTPPPPPPSGRYLSDLTPAVATNGWGPYERDRSNGEAAAGDGRILTLNTRTYTKGLGVHANSELQYQLNKSYKHFTADIGLDDESLPGAAVVFQVFSGSVKLYDSGVMTALTATKKLDLNISTVDLLRLVVTDAGNTTTHDHADWANAFVTL